MTCDKHVCWCVSYHQESLSPLGKGHRIDGTVVFGPFKLDHVYHRYLLNYHLVFGMMFSLAYLVLKGSFFTARIVSLSLRLLNNVNVS